MFMDILCSNTIPIRMTGTESQANRSMCVVSWLWMSLYYAQMFPLSRTIVYSYIFVPYIGCHGYRWRHSVCSQDESWSVDMVSLYCSILTLHPCHHPQCYFHHCPHQTDRDWQQSWQLDVCGELTLNVSWYAPLFLFYDLCHVLWSLSCVMKID